MTHWLICDRCRVKHDDPHYPPAPEIPGGWTEADGYHFCPDCSSDFREFVQNDKPIPPRIPDAIS